MHTMIRSENVNNAENQLKQTSEVSIPWMYAVYYEAKKNLIGIVIAHFIYIHTHTHLD